MLTGKNSTNAFQFEDISQHTFIRLPKTVFLKRGTGGLKKGLKYLLYIHHPLNNDHSLRYLIVVMVAAHPVVCTHPTHNRHSVYF